MPTIIKLTFVHNGEPIFVNADAISTIKPSTYRNIKTSVIELVGNTCVTEVAETPEEIVALIEQDESSRIERKIATVENEVKRREIEEKTFLGLPAPIGISLIAALA